MPEDKHPVEVKTDRVDFCLKIAKIAALLVPAVLSGVLVCVMIGKLGNNSYCLDSLEFKLNTGLSIIGIAVTVWIGLNIYNIIEKSQIERLEIKYGELETQHNKIEAKYNELSSKTGDYIGPIFALHQVVYCLEEIKIMESRMYHALKINDYNKATGSIGQYVQNVDNFLKKNYSIPAEVQIPVSWLSQFLVYIDGMEYCIDYLMQKKMNEVQLDREIRCLVYIVNKYTNIFDAIKQKQYSRRDADKIDMDAIIEYIQIAQAQINGDLKWGILSEALTDQASSVEKLR